MNLELASGFVDDSHPVAINRIYMAERRRNDDAPSRGEAIRQLGARFRSIQLEGAPGGDSPILETPREVCLHALKAAVRELSQHGIDLSSLLEGLG